MAKLNDFESAAAQLGVSPFTVRRWAREALIETVRLGRRRLIPQAEIERIARDGVRTDPQRS